MSAGVVITGSATHCALGATLADSVEALLARQSGFSEAPAVESGPANPMRAAQSRDESLGNGSDRAERLLASALTQALSVAPWRSGLRIGVVLGTTLAGMRHWGAAIRGAGMPELCRASASAVLAEALRRAGVDEVEPAITVSAACASGLTAIRLGAAMIELGRADVVLAGGYDPISEFTYAGFTSLRLIATGAPRPFDAERDGMRLGEGAAIVVLESIEGARSRSRAALATIVGAGESSDAHHLTQPHPEGAGAARAIAAATHGAADIALIAAHATATPNNDASEYRAYEHVLGARMHAAPIVALKSRLGHALGAAGALELALSLECLRRERLPSSALEAKPDRAAFPLLDLVRDERRSARGDLVVTSCGFGGANASMRVALGDATNGALVHGPRRVVVTALGCVIPEGVGLDALRNATGAGAVRDELFAHLIDARRCRRISSFARFVWAATNDLMSRGRLSPADLARCAGIVGSYHGAVGYCDEFYRGLVKDGAELANPLLFAESVPNIGSAHLSLAFALQGPTLSVVGRRSAALEAIDVASTRIASGIDDAVIVVAAEEYAEPALGLVQHLGIGGCDGAAPIGSGGAAILLESEAHATRRGAAVLARVIRCATVATDETREGGVARAVQAALERVAVDGEVLLAPERSWLERGEHLGAARAKRDVIERDALVEMHAVGPLLRAIASIARGVERPFTTVAADPFGAACAVSFSPA